MSAKIVGGRADLSSYWLAEEIIIKRCWVVVVIAGGDNLNLN